MKQAVSYDAAGGFRIRRLFGLSNAVYGILVFPNFRVRVDSIPVGNYETGCTDRAFFS